jgi:hypothetical protein
MELDEAIGVRHNRVEFVCVLNQTLYISTSLVISCQNTEFALLKSLEQESVTF